MEYKKEDDNELVSDLTDSLGEDLNIHMEDEEVYLEEASDESENLNESKRTGWSVKRLLFDIVFYALLIFVSVYIIPNYVLQRTVVDGESMENTLFDGDHLYVEKISYRFDKLDRFDIIVFYPYGRDDDQYYVKRIIGLPGETVQIIDGLIYIDGQVLEEHYGNETILDPGRARDLIELGDDEYFVMGDNRNISKDSRHPSVGNVKKHNIGGKAFFRVSPIKEFGPID